MPCFDGGVPCPPSREEVLDSKAPAMLCAFLRAMEPRAFMQLLEAVDWGEAGVTLAEFLEWRELHQRRDKERRENEARRLQQLQDREAAIAKLSPAERRALGLRDD